MARVPRRRRRQRRSHACPVPDARAAAPLGGAQRRRARPAQHRLHQHDLAGQGAVLPRRRGDGVPDPRRDPLERRHAGAPRPAPRRGRGRPHLVLRLVGGHVRGRVQPLLPRPRCARRRRPDLLPGPRLPRHLRPRVPRGRAQRGPARRVPPGALPPRRQPAQLPAPAAHARFLAVPDRVDGPGSAARDLPGALQPLPAQPRDQGHQPAARLGIPRRRRDRRAGVAGQHQPGRPRGPGQPHVRHQLQPAAPRRTRARQRQHHPGAGVELPRRRMERHQGDLGPRLGQAARPRHRGRPGRPDEQHDRRRLPDLPRRGCRVPAQELLRPRPTGGGHGRRHPRRPAVGAQARRHGLPQALLGVPDGREPHRAADGDPGQDDQGLVARPALREPQRHPPDEEAVAGGPAHVPRPPADPDPRRQARQVPAARTTSRDRTTRRPST